MQSSKNVNSKHTQFFLDKNSAFSKHNQAKSTKNLNISLGANESLYAFNPHVLQNKSQLQLRNANNRTLQNNNRQEEQNSMNQFNRKLNSVVIQNQKLKSENEFLRKQLSKVKKQKVESFHYNSKEKHRVYSRQQSNQHQTGDLRGTIKRQNQQTGDLKELKIKLQILSKQCKMYEQIIDKMQTTIRRLTDQNKVLQTKHKSEQRHSQKDIRKQQFESLKERVNLIMKQYSDLQSKMHSNQLEWVIWKQQWITEKNIYLNKIKQLQAKLKERKDMDL